MRAVLIASHGLALVARHDLGGQKMDQFDIGRGLKQVIFQGGHQGAWRSATGADENMLAGSKSARRPLAPR